MFKFICQNCNNALYSASDYSKQEKIYCPMCETYFDNPYYEKKQD